MNTHRAVRQCLAKEEKKTELKSEKVELAITDDIKDLVKDSFFQRDQVVFILNAWKFKVFYIAF